MERLVKRPAPKPFSAGVGYHVRETHKALTRRLAEELSELGVGLKHYYYLRALLEQDGITQVELGERVGLNRATVTRGIDTMARAGLVRRARDPNDRRKINVVLTPRAQRLREPLLRLVERLNREALTGMSPSETTALRTSLRRVIANLGGSATIALAQRRSA